MNARYSYLSHLQCSLCQGHYDAEKLSTTSPCCDRPLLAQYDLIALAHDLVPSEFASREATMWRYHELLPIYDTSAIVTLGEGWTPLIHAKNLGRLIGLKNLYIKDERQGPTASFKDRQASVAITVMR